MSKRGHLVSFEGIDNCGKSTQIRLLSSHLNNLHINHKVFRDPGSTSLGDVLRRILKHPQEVYTLFNEALKHDPDYKEVSTAQERTPMAEVMLFLAARSEYVNHLITPNLDNGYLVISDRLGDSTRAYQGGGRYYGNKKLIDFIQTANDIILSQCGWPSKTFFLDIPYEEMIRRTGRERDFMESLGQEFFERVIAEYRKIASENPKRIVIMDGTKPIEEIFNNGILRNLEGLL